MKHLKMYSAAFAISLAAASGVHAQSGGMKGMDMKDMPMKDMKEMPKKDMSMKDMKGMGAGKQGEAHKGSGTVEKIDTAKGTVTLAHGPVKTMNWPAMTMTFNVKDKAMLDKIKPGAKVEFGFVQSGKDHVVTEIKAQ
jgi:Cu(I)/Ag(I) efflux system periplasmic protein CusF